MLLLASQSPRRETILKSMGFVFKIVIPNVEEHTDSLFVEDIPILNAKLKADAVSAQYPNDIVLAADTVVEYNRRLFNKPDDENDAVDMLLTLSGKEHKVITGGCIQQQSTNILFSPYKG
jgi:septum formation protein